MFNNLTKEIVYYSLIPVIVLTIIILLLLLIGKEKYANYYKYNYFIKTLLFLIIGLVLPLIIGYTIWIFERFIDKNILSSNLLYIVLLISLIVALVVLLIIIYVKLAKSIKNKDEQK